MFQDCPLLSMQACLWKRGRPQEKPGHKERPVLPLRHGLYTKAMERHLRVFTKGIIQSALERSLRLQSKHKVEGAILEVGRAIGRQLH